MKAVLKSLGTLLLLLLAFPVNVAIVLVAFLVKVILLPFRQKEVNLNPKKILITGGKMTKALQLARLFHRAGHQVILVETHKYWLSGHRFSNAVSKFYTVPAPEKDPQGYSQSLKTIVQTEKIDAFIPVSSPVASYYDAVAGTVFPSECDVIHCSPEMTQQLDNKFTLCELAKSIGLSAPKVFLITDPQQILEFDFAQDGSQYILKSIRYDSVYRLDLTRYPFEGMGEYLQQFPINPENPWVMQEYIQGKEYCTHSTIRKGKITLHCCSESSAFQVNYQQVEKPEIYQWVEKFVGSLNLTGQISFDFLQTADGTVYPIECNPRTHSAITMFYNHPHLAEAYLEDEPPGLTLPIMPLKNSRPTYWTYHEAWRLLTNVPSRKDVKHWLNKVLKGKDAILEIDDPLPFLMVPHWQISLLLIKNLLQAKDWVKIDFNIGKLVELNGD